MAHKEIPLVAKKALRYQHRMMEAGETFSAPLMAAARLIARHEAVMPMRRRAHTVPSEVVEASADAQHGHVDLATDDARRRVAPPRVETIAPPPPPVVTDVVADPVRAGEAPASSFILTARELRGERERDPEPEATVEATATTEDAAPAPAKRSRRRRVSADETDSDE